MELDYQRLNVNPHFLVIGSGRMARHISFYLEQQQTNANPNLNSKTSTEILSLSFWNRKQNSIEELNELLHKKINRPTHILLAISDSAILNFYNSYLQEFDGVVIHFSGALEFKNMISAHPLMTFGPDLLDLETYKKIPFILTGSHKLSGIIPGLKNPSFTIPEERKPYYHALCVLGGNLPMFLWMKLQSGLEDLGLPKELANLYLQQGLENFLRNSKGALTGPLARKDIVTIQKNLISLDGDLYQAVYKAFFPIAFDNFNEVKHEDSRL